MNCNESNASLTVLSVVRGTTAAICTLVSLFTVAIIVYFRLSATVLQRLYLYFSASTLAYLLTMLLGPIVVFEKEQAACAAVGFLSQWTSITELLFTFGITVYLHVLLFRGYCRQSLDFREGTQLLLECLYVAFCVLSPPTVDWLPFTHDLYGRTGGWCWISSLDRNCNDVGFEYQLTLQYLPILLLTLMTLGTILSAYVLLHCAAWRRPEYDSVSRHQRDRARELLVLLLSVSVASFLIVPEVATQVLFYKGHKPSLGVSVLYAVGTPLGKLGLSAALLFYLYSLRMFTWRRVILAWRAWLPATWRTGEAERVMYKTAENSGSVTYGSTDNS